MPFISKNLVKQGASLTAVAPTFWSYRDETDFIANIANTGYFNEASDRLQNGDIIEVKPGSAFGVVASWLAVNSVTGATPVTTTPAIGSFSIAANIISATQTTTTSSENIVPGFMLTHLITTAGGPTADTILTANLKIRVLDVFVQNTSAGSAADTIVVKNNTLAITDAIDVSGVDKSIARALTIDNANAIINAGGTIRITETDGGGNDSPGTLVTIIAVRTP